MTPRENALRIIRFDHPERVVCGYPAHEIAYLGCHHEGYKGGGHHLPVGSRWRDIWGVEWHREHEGVMGFPRGHPLADLPQALREYTWPDPDDERICGRIYEQARGWNREESLLCGSHRDTLWEKSYMLVGMEDLMCFFYSDPGAVRELFHRIMDFHLGIARHYLNCGVELVMLTDDLGTQNGPLMAPEFIREFMVPEYRRLIELYKQNKVLINFHSCGHIVPVLEILMDLGVDILNPVQATANDLGEVRRITDGRMALQGGIGSAILYHGPVKSIKKEVAYRILQLGQKGGYFCCPDQGLPWPEEHIRALHEAVEEYGRYPLRVVE